MKRNLFLLIALLCFLPVSFSQDITWGPDIKVKNKDGGVFNYMLENDNSSFFAMRTKGGFSVLFSGGQSWIARYNRENLTLEDIHTLFPDNFFDKGKNLPKSVDGLFTVGGKKYIFFSNYDKKKFTSYYCVLDEEYNFSGPPEIIDERDVDKNSRSGSYNIALSEDSTKFLLYYLTPYSRNENEQISFMVYDVASMSKQATRDLILPKKDKDFVIQSLTLSSDNKVYLLSQENYEKEEIKNKSRKEPKYYYTFYEYPAEDIDSEPFEYKIELKNKFINDLSVVFIQNHIVISGFYGLKNSDDISGIFYMRLDRFRQEIEVEDVYEFPKEFIEEFYNLKQIQKAEKKDVDLEVPEMVFRNFIVNEDGSALLIAEQFYIVERCYTDSKGNMRCVYYYYYNDIIATHINANGEIEWCTKIPKKSVSTDGGVYLSYALGMTNNNLYFFFNDNAENENVTDIKSIKPLGNLKKAVISMVTVNIKDGSMEKQTVFSQEKAQYFFIPKRSDQFNDSNEMLLYTIGKTERLGILKLPK